MKIYIAGPYSAPTEEERLANVTRACQAAAVLILKGHCPFVPHLSHFIDHEVTKSGNKVTWDDWMKQCEVWFEQCEALLYLSSSRGADIEREWAWQAGMPIYQSVDEVPNTGRRLL